ncbi:MAG TPA: NAD-dependent epimerase/dehydratase family protein [Candidatus Thermoplasmatota archaeon]|nr:NAD-dependent epimerase/dehydratase family protein [Candidatus Thermoplasmatota archaeon]
MRVLVTGSEGQVGSWVRSVQPADAAVQPLDLKGEPRVDVRSPEALALAAKADVVLHLAALIDVAASVEDPEETHDVNVEGTANLLRGCRRGARFVLVSSAAVYGDAGDRAVGEGQPCHPMSPYGASKLEAERRVREDGEARGVDWCVVRPFNIYSGSQDLSSPYAGVITAFMEACFTGQPLRIDGDGQQTRDFIHASDVAAFLWMAARDPRLVGGTFNVATGTSLPVLDLASQVMACCGVRLPLRFAPPRTGDIRHSRASVARAAELGWTPRVPLDEGLRETASGLRQRLQARPPRQD